MHYDLTENRSNAGNYAIRRKSHFPHWQFGHSSQDNSYFRKFFLSFSHKGLHWRSTFPSSHAIMKHVNVCILTTCLFLLCFFFFYIFLVFALLSLVKQDICCLGLQKYQNGNNVLARMEPARKREIITRRLIRYLILAALQIFLCSLPYSSIYSEDISNFVQIKWRSSISVLLLWRGSLQWRWTRSPLW